MFAKFFRKIVPAKPGTPRVSYIVDKTLPQDILVIRTPNKDPIVDFLMPFISYTRAQINVLRNKPVLPSEAARKLGKIADRIDNFQRMITCPTGLDLDLSVQTIAELITSISTDLSAVMEEMGIPEEV
jgi:hypothetical protein